MQPGLTTIFAMGLDPVLVRECICRMKLNSEAYYADVHKMSIHGGKMWIAPDHLIREEVW
jgi:ATPase complex subunit ATP10